MLTASAFYFYISAGYSLIIDEQANLVSLISGHAGTNHENDCIFRYKCAPTCFTISTSRV